MMREAARPLAIANRQRRARPRRGDILSLVDRILASEGEEGGLELALVGERTIRALHRDWLDDDTVTDVISFPLGKPLPGPDATAVPIGSVAVCVPVCERSALALRVPLHDEIARMLIHGTLHVLGYDHDTSPKRQRMRARERRYLAWYRRTRLEVVESPARRERAGRSRTKTRGGS
jgi:probable rRNA maturation factor